MTTRRPKRHNPEQIVRKLRDADAMLNAGKDLVVALHARILPGRMSAPRISCHDVRWVILTDASDSNRTAGLISN